MRRTWSKLSLHLVVLLCMLAAVLTHGKFVLWRAGVFWHTYWLLGLVLFLVPVLAWLVTGWEHWLHVPGVLVILAGLYIACALTPVMNRKGETGGRFDSRMSVVQAGWTREQVLQDCGEPHHREEHDEGGTWVYQWEGREGGKNTGYHLCVWGDGLEYRVTFDATGQVREVARREYGWDVMGHAILPIWWRVIEWGPIVAGSLALATLTVLCLTSARVRSGG